MYSWLIQAIPLYSSKAIKQAPFLPRPYSLSSWSSPQMCTQSSSATEDTAYPCGLLNRLNLEKSKLVTLDTLNGAGSIDFSTLRSLLTILLTETVYPQSSRS